MAACGRHHWLRLAWCLPSSADRRVRREFFFEGWYGSGCSPSSAASCPPRRQWRPQSMSTPRGSSRSLTAILLLGSRNTRSTTHHLCASLVRPVAFPVSMLLVTTTCITPIVRLTLCRLHCRRSNTWAYLINHARIPADRTWNCDVLGRVEHLCRNRVDV